MVVGFELIPPCPYAAHPSGRPTSIARKKRSPAAAGGAVGRPEAQAPRNAVIYLLQLNFLQERCADDIAIVFQDPLAKTLQSVFLAIYEFRPFDS